MICKIKNKKGTQLPTEAVIFLVLNIFFFCALLFFVWRATSETAVVEEITAKKLGLIIDEMRPGTEINISVNGLYSIMEKNKFDEFPMHIEGNTITVRASIGNGYSFRFFSNLNPTLYINKNDPNKILTIKT